MLKFSQTRARRIPFQAEPSSSKIELRIRNLDEVESMSILFSQSRTITGFARIRYCFQQCNYGLIARQPANQIAML